MRKGFFEQDFLRTLPPQPALAMSALLDEFQKFINAHGGPSQNWQEAHYEDYVEALAIVSAYCKSRDIDFTLPLLGNGWHADTNAIIQYVHERHIEWKRAASLLTSQTVLFEKQNEYASIFGTVQIYEFTDNEISQIQKLTNELREMISSSKLLTPDHQRRLLHRLEAMQREIHKRTSEIDRFWGFLAEAGIVTRKFGEDLKPISDRVTELGKIVITVLMAKEGIKALPEITKLLGN